MAEPNDVPAGWETFRFAAFMEKFSVLPPQLAEMTDYQLDALCAHPRTSEGALIPPKSMAPEPEPAPATLADKLMIIDRMEHDRLVTPAKAAELREQVRRAG